MQEVIRVAGDAMGGDNAPGEIVKGAIEAVNTRRDIQVVLVGQQEVIAEELKKYTYEKDQIEIKNATEVIETAEHPVNAIRNEYGKTEGSRCICIGRKFRSRISWWTGDCWKNPWYRASAFGTADSDRDRSIPAH